MKLGIAKTYGGANLIEFRYHSGAFQSVSASTITPNTRDLVDIFIQDNTQTHVYRDIVTEYGMVTQVLVPQFELLLSMLKDNCEFNFVTTTVEKAKLVEIRFQQIASLLTAGNDNNNTQDGIRKLTTPLGSQIEFFESANKVSENKEILEELAFKLSPLLCADFVKTEMPFFSAHGLRLSEVEESINHTTSEGLDAEGL
jgi:hypothetical protein